MNQSHPLLTATILCLFSASASSAGDKKISPDLKDRKGTLSVLIQYRLAPTQLQMEAIGSRHKGTINRTFPETNTLSVDLPSGSLEDLSENSEVVYVSANRPLQANMVAAGPAVGTISAVFQGVQGNGVTVAVIDSGVTEHTDLAGRIVYAESFIGKLGQSKNAVADTFGHGTVVAGILAGSGEASGLLQPVRGIAPKVNIVSLRALDANGKGTDASVIAAINRAIELKDKYKIRVVNLSLGRPVFESFRTDPLCRAVEAAWKAGLVVVVAAGNSGRDNSFGNQGYGTIQSPANDPRVITVGAMRTMSTITRSDDLIATYSSKGPSPVDHIVKPDLVAPGNLIMAAAPTLTSLLGRDLAAQFCCAIPL